MRLDIRQVEGDWSGMPKMRKKSDLPSKPCAVCGRPFTWRKKWEKVWADVKFCSDACRMRKHSAARP